jgi:hypothetical protein
LIRRGLRAAGRLLSWLVLAGLTLWSSAAIYYSNLPAAWLRSVAAVLFVLGTVALFFRVRPLWRARLIFLAAFGGVVVWFLAIPPSNDRDWQPDVAVLPYAEINGDMVTVHNIRNCDYRSETDYTVRHYDKTFDLSKLKSVDLYVVHWGSPAIAHTMLSFGFGGGDYLCFSIETRKEKSESYSTTKGFFRQFEITYIVGDERDLVRLRTNYRGEQVYLYRFHSDLAVGRPVFLDYCRQINRLKQKPEWYNALADNCTTSIHQHTYPYARKVRWDWRILVNGYVDELAYEAGTLDRSLPFAELKQHSLINERAKAAGHDADFSARIREGLPGFPMVETAPATRDLSLTRHGRNISRLSSSASLPQRLLDGQAFGQVATLVNGSMEVD